MYAIKDYANTYKESGEHDIYLVTSIGSALGDLTVTSLTLYREVMPLSKVSLKVSSEWFAIDNKYLKNSISFSRLKVAGLVAGGLTAILDIWQGVRLIDDKDNDAGIASIFAGVGMGIAMGSELLASTALLAAMGLTPLGLLSLGLFLGAGGMFLRELWKDNKVDKWLIGQEDKSIEPSPFYTGIENEKSEIELIAELFRLIEIDTSFRDERDSSMTIASGLLSHPSMSLLTFNKNPIISMELEKRFRLSSARNQRSFITPMVKGKWLNGNEGQIIGFDCLYHQNEIAAKYSLSTVAARWQGELVLFDINQNKFVPQKLVFSYKKNDSEQQYNDGKLEIEWLA
ncbi:hypothetical protein [Photobacterium sp.]|uniref:hypothetical protein n=1 Tax=Photobacterium sp. TaxID=660 RepID=UPI00299D5F89|nr:hypothetical protein [Photobacterium sp.]MDX1302290.1 hypothetical protein [Photobacterium sp.]